MGSIVEEFRDIEHLSIEGLEELKNCIVKGIALGVANDVDGLNEEMGKEMDKDLREAMQIAFDLGRAGRLRDIALHIGNIDNRIQEIRIEEHVSGGNGSCPAQTVREISERRDMERVLMLHAESLKRDNGNGRSVPVRRT